MSSRCSSTALCIVTSLCTGHMHMRTNLKACETYSSRSSLSARFVSGRCLRAQNCTWVIATTEGKLPIMAWPSPMHQQHTTCCTRKAEATPRLWLRQIGTMFLNALKKKSWAATVLKLHLNPSRKVSSAEQMLWTYIMLLSLWCLVLTSPKTTIRPFISYARYKRRAK